MKALRSSKPQGTARTKAIVKVLAKALVEASAKFKNVPSSDNGNELAFTARHLEAGMNVRIVTLLRDSCREVSSRGIRIIRGAWAEWDTEKIIAADPICAVLIVQGRLPPGLNPMDPATMVRPGLWTPACELLGVDTFWLYRFWMGYDRGFQILSVNEKGEENKDDVSEFGINFAKEVCPK